MPYAARRLLRVSPAFSLCCTNLASSQIARPWPSAVLALTTGSYRGYASKPRGKFSPSKIYSSFVKKSLASESWQTVGSFDEELDDSLTLAEQIAQNARQLKESLAAPPGKDFLDYYSIRSNLLALLASLPPSSPRQNAYSKYKSLLETSILLVLKESDSSSHFIMSIQDICQVYSVLIRNGANDLVDSNLLPKIFSVIQSSKELTQQQQLESSLEYLKFLDAQQKVEEAEKLLQWILSVYGPLSEKNFSLAIQAVNYPHINFACLALLFSSYRMQGNQVSHEALVFALKSLVSSEFTDSSHLSKFSEFVKANVIQDKSQYSNIAALCLILEAFLESRDSKGARDFVKMFDNSISLSKLTFESDAVEKQFLKLVAIAEMKFSSSGNVNSLLQKLDALDGNDLELKLYGSLYTEQDSTTLARIFNTWIETGLEVTEPLLNNAIEIMVQRGHDLVTIKNVLSTVCEEHGIDSNVETYDILMTSALNNNDVEFAIQLFHESLQDGAQWQLSESVHLKVLDKLVVAMCETLSSDVFRVFKIYQQVRTFAKTVGYEAQASLLKLFLSYNYVGDCEKFLEDELGTESRNLPRDSQPLIYDALYSYAINCQNYKDSWLIYGLSQKYFHAPYDSYFTVMKHFCKLGRPDAALIIFKNMRNRSKATGSKPPDEAIYSLLFHEFGQSGYAQGVFELHTLFKMDTSVEADTLVLNEIMHAYCELDDTQQAVEIWSQISASPKELGPTNDSYTIMLKVCTKVSIQDVEHMWTMLLESEKEPDDQNYRQYIIANCYHGFYVRALDVAKSMSAKGIEPSNDTLSALYNWTLLENRKEDVSTWAQTNFPEKWDKLLAEGNLKTYLLDESNPNNDSEDHLRQDINSKLATEGKNILPVVL